MNYVGLNIVRKAQSHVGECEDPMGSNRGPIVDLYNEYVGNAPGSPWCAAFGCYIVGKVRDEMGGKWPVPCTGSSGAIADWGEVNNAGRAGADVIPGCLGEVIDANSATGHRHTVIAIEILSSGMVETVEGNEGDCVKRWRRRLDECDWVQCFPDQDA